MPSTGITHVNTSYHSQQSHVVHIVFTQFYDGETWGIYSRSHNWEVMGPAFTPGRLDLELTLRPCGYFNCLVHLSSTRNEVVFLSSFLQMKKWLCRCPYPRSLAGGLDWGLLLLVLVPSFFALFREHFANLRLLVVGNELLNKKQVHYNDRPQGSSDHVEITISHLQGSTRCNLEKISRS